MAEAISTVPPQQAMSSVPKMAFGYEMRQPFPRELEHFKNNPKTAGMATKDNRIILNPYSKLNAKQKQSVMMNEAARLYMREKNIVPNFEPTQKQIESFRGSPYENDPVAMKQTITARMLSGDSSASYGTRKDGTLKGGGFLGELKRPDGKVSTELSIGVEFDGEKLDIPSLVPTLTKQEIDYLLGGGKMTKAIVNKAVAHARKRMDEGKSPFFKGTDDINMEKQKKYADTILSILKKRK